jgi:3-keto-5-aminohexanoate cleavage enzyme
MLEKLIVTVTCDSTMSYPSNPSNPTPKGWDVVADEYVRSVNAGASICHLHGPYNVDAEIQADGTKLSDLEIPGWGRLRDAILDRCDTVIQYGIANGRFPQRKELIRAYKPDMISVCFNAHDECFNYEPGKAPVELYGLHNRAELAEYVRVTRELGVKMEIEAFHYGGVWNALRMIETESMDPAAWVTFFLGWRGGCWTPPTVKALLFMHDHLPSGFRYNTSVMDPEHAWTVLTAAIMMGGHVRVGMEDNPFLTPGEYARCNAELVDKVIRIAREIGREIATPDEARATLRIGKH